MNEDAESVTKRLLTSPMSNLKRQRFKVTHIFYTLFLLSFAVLQLIAMAFFTRGFLLTRTVLTEYSDTVEVPPVFSKTVILVIDALRYDFAVPQDSQEFYHNNLEVLYETVVAQPGQSLLYKFMADPPTTTLQRLKGLTTGSLPTFVDIGSNFDGDLIEEDNLIRQLWAQGKRVAFAGDDTWDALFGPFLNISYPYESLNVWDLDTVDHGVMEHMTPLLKEDSWDVLIGHCLGVDHVGHRYGPNHHSMRSKQKEMDSFIRDIMATLDNDTLFIVMGDHGMDYTGNHGGDSIDELEATLFMYSKRPGVFKNQLTFDSAVDQIDLVPTLSLLLGVPIPFNNLGFPINEAFVDETLPNWSTLKQIQSYRQHSSSLKDDSEVNALFNALNIENADFNVRAKEYQVLSLERCKDLWARFDMVSIGIGIGLMLVSLILMIIITQLIPSVVVSTMVEEFVPSIATCVVIFSVIVGSVVVVFKTVPLLWAIAFAAACGIIVGMIIPVADRYNFKWFVFKLHEVLCSFWSFTGIALMMVHTFLFTSNSFTIWEDRILTYLLATVGCIFAIKSYGLEGRIKKYLGVYHSLVFLICTRLCSNLTICREEQGTMCEANFTTTPLIIALLYLSAFSLPYFIQSYYNVSSSYQSAAPLWIGKGFTWSMFLIAIYWTLQYVEQYVPVSAEVLKILKSCSFTTSRIVFGMTLVAANLGWFMGPLCVRLDITNSDTSNRAACILGYGNVYGSQYFLLVVNFAAVVLLFSKPLGQLSLALMIIQMLSVVELLDILGLKDDLFGPVVFAMLGSFHFFTTGHQATIPSIHWDVAFMLTETISFPFSQLAVIFNSFGSFILATLAVPLCMLWKLPPEMKPVSLLAKIVGRVEMLIIYFTTLTLSNFIWVTHFRRHLMVWKIFAPRFMFSCMVLIVIQVIAVVVVVGFATGKQLLQIHRLFGKD